MDPAVKTLKHSKKPIRDIAANALNQVGHSQGELARNKQVHAAESANGRCIELAATVSDRSNSAASGIALVRLPCGQDAAQVSQFFVYVFGFKHRVAHDFAQNRSITLA